MMDLIKKGVLVVRWLMLGSLPVIICFFLVPLLRLTSTRDEGGVDVCLSADAGVLLRNSSWGLSIYDTEDGREKLFMDLRAVTVALSPDGRRFAHAALEGDVCLRGIPDGRLQRVLTYEGRDKAYGVCVSSLAFSSNGQLLAGTKDGRVYLWEVETGRLKMALACRGKEPWIRGVAFAPDAKTVAALYLVTGPSGEEDEPKARLVLWETDTGKAVNNRVLAGDSYKQLVFSPDGELLAIAGFLEGVELLRADTCERIRVFEGSPLAFSPDGSLLAFIRHFGAHVQPVRGGGEETTMQGGPPTDRPSPSPLENPVLSFSRGGRSLTAATPEGTAYTWDVSTGNLLGSVLGLRQAVVRIPKLWALILILWIVLWELAGWAPQRRAPTGSGQRAPQSRPSTGYHLVTFAAALVLALGVVIPLLFQDPGAPSAKWGRMVLPLGVCLIGLGCVLGIIIARRPPRVNGLVAYSLALTIALVVFQCLLVVVMLLSDVIASAG